MNAQGVVISLKVDQSRAVLATASAAAAGIAAAPIPMSDAALLRPVQLGMLASITAIFGIELSNDQALSLVKGTVGQGGMELAGKRLVKELAKHVPGGNVVNAAVAGRAHRRARRGLHPALRRDAAPPGRGQADARRRGGQVPDGDLRQPAAQAHGASPASPRELDRPT